MSHSLKRLLLVPAFLCLLLGLYGGLARMDVLPAFLQTPVLFHGPLMAVGFLAALIAAERAVTLNNVLTTVSSSFFSIGGLTLVFGFKFVNAVLWLGGSIAFLLWSIWMFIRFRKNFSNMFFIASASFLAIGNLFFILDYMSTYFGLAWVVFFTTFIIGERMDMLKITGASRTSYIIAGFSIPVTAVGLAFFNRNVIALALVFLFYSAVKHDFALRFIKRTGFSRYLSIGLGAAYSWLGASAILWNLPTSLDIVLHSMFLGFVATMVFTHAPIILPAILRTRHIYTPLFYIPFAMLQGSTILRITSAINLQTGLWSLSGLVTVLSVLVFLAVGLTSNIRRKTLYSK